MQTGAEDLASGPRDPSNGWIRGERERGWNGCSGARKLGKRLMWFPEEDAYEVVYDDVVLPDQNEPCTVTFIVTRDENYETRNEGSKAFTLNMFAVNVLEKLLADEDVPAPGDKIFNGKPWAQSLMESKCLALGFTSDGIGHIHDVGTRDADEYGGCGCFSRGKLLMQLADYVACKFGQTSMVLMDSSRIQCRNLASVEESMTLFYTLKTGESWYESFGYEYATKHEDAAQAVKAVGDAQINWSDSDLEIQNLLRIYLQEDPTHHSSLSNRQFIMWIWDTQCDKWKAAVAHIYGKTLLAPIQAGIMQKALTCEKDS